jgi:hypothetical protein
LFPSITRFYGIVRDYEKLGFIFYQPWNFRLPAELLQKTPAFLKCIAEFQNPIVCFTGEREGFSFGKIDIQQVLDRSEAAVRA